MIVAVLTGGELSWVASATHDGLEWSIENTFSRPELSEQEHGVLPASKKIHESTAFLPDYGFRKSEGKAEDTGEAK